MILTSELSKLKFGEKLVLTKKRGALALPKIDSLFDIGDIFLLQHHHNKIDVKHVKSNQLYSFTTHEIHECFETLEMVRNCKINSILI
jgi:hypothetical protein